MLQVARVCAAVCICDSDPPRDGISSRQCPGVHLRGLRISAPRLPAAAERAVAPRRSPASPRAAGRTGQTGRHGTACARAGVSCPSAAAIPPAGRDTEVRVIAGPARRALDHFGMQDDGLTFRSVPLRQLQWQSIVRASVAVPCPCLLSA